VSAERTALSQALQDLINEAQVAEREARRPAARDRYEAVLHGLREASQASVAAALMRWIGRTYIDDADLDAALDCFEAALAVSEASADLSGIAQAINLIANDRWRGGELDEAEQLYLRALESAKAAGESKLAAMIEQNLGTIANIRGDLQVALTHYTASLAAYRALGRTEPLGLSEHVGRLLNNLGMLYTDLRQWGDAEQAYAEALSQCIASGNVSDQLMVEVNRAELWIAQREFGKARAACDAALALAAGIGDERVLGETYKHYGVIARELGERELADDYLRRASRIAEERRDLLLAAETSREQAELYWRQERHRETLQSLNRAHRLFSQLRARLDLADVDRRVMRLEEMFLDIVRRWGESIESKDRYTQGHCVRVAAYACALAKAVGFSETTLFWFRMGALLHDVGKLIVPSEILNKPGRLTSEERELMERHPVAGVELLADIDFPWDIRPMVRHHHERWDGAGYPDRLGGEGIPLSARILCVADVYDALITTRSYRPAYVRADALEIMNADAGRMFDPELFPQFIELGDPADLILNFASPRGGEPGSRPLESSPPR
jgi:putative nucleotidyltransferase with HDIG domain